MTMEASLGSRIRPMPRDDEGVSPVVGMILVLAISIVGIAAILYWGLPAIDEMKANVEHRSLQSQFQDLDSTLKELVAGTTEKTAKRWQPTLNRGEVVVRNNTESWLFTADGYQGDDRITIAKNQYDFVFGNLADGDYSFTIFNNASFALQTIQVQGYTVGAGSSLTPLNLTCVECNTTAGAQTTSFSSWSAQSSRTFRAYVANAGTATPYPIDKNVFYFKITNSSSLVGEAWYMNVSAVQYKLRAGVTDRAVTETNGAILTTTGSSSAFLNAPPVPPPKTSNGGHRFFARAMVLYGNASAAGDNQFDMLVSLYSTSVLASHDCVNPRHDDCASAAKITIWSPSYGSAWYSYLTDANRGYTSVKQLTNGGVTYLEDRQGMMAFTLIESTLNVG